MKTKGWTFCSVVSINKPTNSKLTSLNLSCLLLCIWLKSDPFFSRQPLPLSSTVHEFRRKCFAESPSYCFPLIRFLGVVLSYFLGKCQLVSSLWPTKWSHSKFIFQCRNRRNINQWKQKKFTVTLGYLAVKSCKFLHSSSCKFTATILN